jgi:hypothetical protein
VISSGDTKVVEKKKRKYSWVLVVCNPSYSRQRSGGSRFEASPGK